MRKSFKKAMALLLTAATMAGCMALWVNATATTQYKRSIVGDNEGSDMSYINGIMRYSYDTDNLNILTKVESYSEFIGIGSYSVSPGSANVYLKNTVTVKYSASSNLITYESTGQNFTPIGNIRQTEMGLSDGGGIDLDSNYRTEYALTGHWLNVYSTDMPLLYTSNYWE